MVTFMGTKQRRDLLTNANLILEPVWPEDVTAGPLPAVVRALARAAQVLLTVPCRAALACPLQATGARGEGSRDGHQTIRGRALQHAHNTSLKRGSRLLACMRARRRRLRTAAS